MHLLWRRYGRDFYQGRPAGVAEDAMAELILDATGVDTKRFLSRYVDGCADVPLDELLPLAGFALEWKTAAQPSLGARLRKAGEGVQIAAVLEGSSAHRAGLSALDTIMAIDGLRVDSPAMVEAAVERSRAGATLTFHVFRNDMLHVFEVRLLGNTNREAIVHRQP